MSESEPVEEVEEISLEEYNLLKRGGGALRRKPKNGPRDEHQPRAKSFVEKLTDAQFSQYLKVIGYPRMFVMWLASEELTGDYCMERGISEGELVERGFQ